MPHDIEIWPTESGTTKMKTQPDVSIMRDGAEEEAILERTTRFFEFSLAYMGAWEGACVNLVFALINGGPRTLFFDMIIAVVGALAEAACMGEMASMIPVAGAQYHWTWHMAPKRIKMFATWVQGWTTWFGYIALQAARANILVVQLESLISLNWTTYVTGGRKTSVLVIACALMNVYAFKVVPWLEMISSILHVGLFVLVLVVFVVMAPAHDASFLLEPMVASGWDQNPYISWHLGMLTCIFSIAGIDGVIHTRRARPAVHRAMVWSIAINGSLAIIMAGIILIYMGNADVALRSPNPFATIMLNITGSRAATTAIICGFFLLGFNSSLTTISSVSRLTWAWSRDGGLPAYFTSTRSIEFPFARVQRHNVPISIRFLLQLLGCVWFACLLYSRLAENITMGEWNMGKWGIPVNTFALIYKLYIIVFLPFPSVLPITASGMNYMGPVSGFVLIVVIAWWFLYGRSRWHGPNLTIMECVMTHS
ncbi:hypothetical protein N8I77_004836 [Diaporthe amygdali]|uniref:Amino acid permease n=1 Tax=Phomopsis amygdali TaxID=1214568 RepID=A0AAD9SP90_PHOAM|nr:hypothetical protein N8I77_004836 [Diaporthe amygdali]